jgi:hypothetical protein
MTITIGAVAEVILPPGLKVIVMLAPKVTGVPEPDIGNGQAAREAGHTLEKVPVEGHEF